MGAMKLCFLVFCLSLALLAVSPVKRLNNIDDLTNTEYGKSKPRHGLQLLFWFAQQVNIDQNNNKILLNFYPNSGAFGFHRFGDREGILEGSEHGQYNYEVGNLNSRRYPAAAALPAYVRMHYSNNHGQERNMDRLIVSLDETTTNRIQNVFITAHIQGNLDFNSDDTYEINPDLLSQIRQTYPCTDNEQENKNRCNQFLERIGYNSCRSNSRMKRSPYSQCNTFDSIKLEIKTTTQGYSKLKWENITPGIMKTYKYVYIDICQNTHSSDTNEDPTRVRKTYFLISGSSGVFDTSVSLNAGLQPRLRLYTSYLNYRFGHPDFWYGPEFDGANRVIPIRIKGVGASLQLYAEYGKACARLYIKKTFSNWKDVLKHSWVGFYKSSQHENNDYYTFQYAVKFALIDKTTTEDYDIYQYDSKLTIAPGVQIRFLLDKKYDKVLAQTTPWESDVKVTSICNKDNIQPDPSSPWSFPEFFYEPGYYDANNVIPIKIRWYDAGLQLFTKDGKACARLYIKKTFKDWKDIFWKSWVGFYTSSQGKNSNYYIYQYAVNFEKMEGGTENFDIYQYKSKLTIAPGVQIRFMIDKGYENKLVQTEPWKSG
uniref:Uncharacterized protein n=1 Tax=Sinocyclocheilus anshuiensis TaxID=1608454 RepID=A0A671PF67_9TELE